MTLAPGGRPARPLACASRTTARATTGSRRRPRRRLPRRAPDVARHAAGGLRWPRASPRSGRRCGETWRASTRSASPPGSTRQSIGSSSASPSASPISSRSIAGHESGLWRHVAGIDEQTPTREALARGRGLRVDHRAPRELGAGRAAPGRPGPARPRRHGAGGGPRRRRAARSRGPARGPLRAPDQPGRRRRAGGAPCAGARWSPSSSTARIGGRGDAEVPFFGASGDVPAGALRDRRRRPARRSSRVLRARAGREPIGSTSSRRSRCRGGPRPRRSAPRSAILERYVRAHWDQWFNFYDVWGRVA